MECKLSALTQKQVKSETRIPHEAQKRCPDDTKVELIPAPGLPAGTIALRFQGKVEKAFPDNVLYRENPPEIEAEPVTLTGIPYALWGNRGRVTELRTWLRTL